MNKNNLQQRNILRKIFKISKRRFQIRNLDKILCLLNSFRSHNDTNKFCYEFDYDLEIMFQIYDYDANAGRFSRFIIILS